MLLPWDDIFQFLRKPVKELCSENRLLLLFSPMMANTHTHTHTRTLLGVLSQDLFSVRAHRHMGSQKIEKGESRREGKKKMDHLAITLRASKKNVSHWCGFLTFHYLPLKASFKNFQIAAATEKAPQTTTTNSGASIGEKGKVQGTAKAKNRTKKCERQKKKNKKSRENKMRIKAGSHGCDYQIPTVCAKHIYWYLLHLITNLIDNWLQIRLSIVYKFYVKYLIGILYIRFFI